MKHGTRTFWSFRRWPDVSAYTSVYVGLGYFRHIQRMSSGGETLTQEPTTDANLRDQSLEVVRADPSHDTRSQQSGPGEISPEMRESMRSIVREEIQKQLTDLDYARILAERAAHNEEYVELKLREAFSSMPGIKSVAYTRKCDEWTLVMLHDDEDKAGAHMRLSTVLPRCALSGRPPLFPAIVDV